jgi:hypothetical protein
MGFRQLVRSSKEDIYQAIINMKKLGPKITNYSGITHG